MPAREFVVTAANQTVQNALSTLIFINPPAAPNVSLEVTRITISQSANATSAQQRVQISIQPTTFPSGGTGIAPLALNRGDTTASVLTSGGAGAAGTAGFNYTSENGGTKTALFSDAFNVLNGWLWVPTPEERIVLPAGFASGLGVVFPAAPTTLTGWTFNLFYREV